MDRARRIVREEGYRKLLIKGLRFIMVKLVLEGVLELPLFADLKSLYVSRRIRRDINNMRVDIGSWIDYAFNFNVMQVRIRPMQVREEIITLLKMLIRLNPKRVLEIGTANGGTLFLLCRVASPDATIISIDLPGGPFGGGYPEWKTRIYKAFTKPYQKLFLLRADSHSTNTLNKVKHILNGEKLDLLFIDGDHTYEGVRRDFEMYSPLVKPGGIIVLHDIVPGPEKFVGGVPSFWRELKKRLESHAEITEIVKDWSQGGYGVGVIRVTRPLHWGGGDVP